MVKYFEWSSLRCTISVKCDIKKKNIEYVAQFRNEPTMLKFT